MDDSMQISWNDTPRPGWDAAHAKLGAPLQQHWAYGDSLVTQRVQVHRAEVRIDGKTVAFAQFLCRRYAGVVGIALCTRGPLWLESVTDADRAKIYRELRRSLPMRRPRFILFSPDLTDARDPSLAALTRVLTGYSTVILDLTPSEALLRAALHPYWRNRLAAAERSALQVSEVVPEPDAYRWVLQEEMQQRERKRFYALPPAFIDNYIAAHDDARQAALILTAELQSQPVAAMLFLIHGSAATYQLGWSIPRGRAGNAHNLVLWRAMRMLKERGVTTLDLGGVNTEDLPGISRFKINTGGKVVTYAGGFV
jgi:lipid II:glycine glycyltransferase (peptidoglycan interpeptide bridge formation enzyme)